MVYLKVDSKDRIWDELADEKVFKAMAKRGNAEMQNQNLTGHVYRLKLAGTYILTDDLYIGLSILLNDSGTTFGCKSRGV